MVLGELTLSTGPAGGLIQLKGRVRRSDDIAHLEESIRPPRLQVGEKSSREDHPDSSYPYAFDASVMPEKGGKP